VNVIGEKLTVLTASDPTKVGRTGLVVLETANMLLLDSMGAKVMVEKAGSAFMLKGSKSVVLGSDIAGRLQDRLGRRPY
jgi:RNase P/RNase MRP subunit p29